MINWNNIHKYLKLKVIYLLNIFKQIIKKWAMKADLLEIRKKNMTEIQLIKNKI